MLSFQYFDVVGRVTNMLHGMSLPIKQFFAATSLIIDITKSTRAVVTKHVPPFRGTSAISVKLIQLFCGPSNNFIITVIHVKNIDDDDDENFIGHPRQHFQRWQELTQSGLTPEMAAPLTVIVHGSITEHREPTSTNCVQTFLHTCSTNHSVAGGHCSHSMLLAV